MSEEINDTPEQDEPLMQHELCEIIDSAVYVIQTLADLDSVAVNEDKDDIVALRKHTYKVIYAAQRKILQKIKAS